MKACFRPVVVGLCLAVIFVAESRAQEPRPAPIPVAEGAAAAQQARQRDLAAIMPLKVRVVLSKYQGDKKISSLPYELTVRTDNVPSNIRMSTQVPVLTFGSPAPGSDAGGKPAPKIGPFAYRDVGTNIDARAVNLDPGRYAITVAIDDSSIYKDERRTAGTSQVEDVVAIRSYRTQNSTILRDGQSTEFTVASDKMTGEVMKAEVSISIIK